MADLRQPWVPSPTPQCPRPADCFYCRWYLACPIHAGEPMDYAGWMVANVRRDVGAAQNPCAREGVETQEKAAQR